MIIKATHKNARIAPRKVRPYRQLVKGLPVALAESQLKFLPGKAPQLIRAVLRSAVANATTNFKLEPTSLVVADVVVDGGFSFKRFRPMSKGMAYSILKRTAHLTVLVEEGVSRGAGAPASTEKATKPRRRARTAVVGTTEEGPKKPTKLTTRRPDKAQAATTKIHMMQQGGDVHKTHRRKSVKGK